MLDYTTAAVDEMAAPSSAADLTFATVFPRLLMANVKFKTGLESLFASVLSIPKFATKRPENGANFEIGTLKRDGIG